MLFILSSVCFGKNKNRTQCCAEKELPMKKLRVVLLFGGKSAEHEVSIQSAKNIAAAADKKKYEISLVYIGKDGSWYLLKDSDFFLSAKHEQWNLQKSGGERVFFLYDKGSVKMVRFSDYSNRGKVDVVFPALHGPFGEDGTVQGLFKLYGLPFVGAGVTGSAVGMDKDVMKRLLREAGVPGPRFLVFTSASEKEIVYEKVREWIGSPMFVKPVHLGSSVGIRKAGEESEFRAAVKEAFRFDSKIIIEECIRGREIECSVLGNRDDPAASLPGEIVPQHEFYSYDAKYIDEEGADLYVPAQLEEETRLKIQELAVKTFKVLCCEGMARVDFFLRENNEVLVNEINTLPGFTNISMYPKLWEASGIPVSVLIDKLIALAFERFRRDREREKEGVD